jgi:hypothetical protein
MSRPASDAATFVLFEPLSAAAGRAEDGGFQLKVVPAGEPGSAHPAPFPHAHAHVPGSPASISQPVVTLQREGDKVTGIRIACVCGQVIELACAY